MLDTVFTNGYSIAFDSHVKIIHTENMNEEYILVDPVCWYLKFLEIPFF